MSEIARDDKESKKTIIKLFLLIILVLSLILIGIKIYFKRSLLPVAVGDSKEIIIKIPSGSTTNDISKMLKERGLIRSRVSFKKVVKEKELDGYLKAGAYVLSNDMDVFEIIEQLKIGGKNDNVITFTIPEGAELRQISKKLEELKLVDGDVFIEVASDVSNFWDKYLFLKELPKGQSLEGFLYPATYEVYINSTEEEIIDKMLSKFEQIYERELKYEIKNVGLNLNQIVTLASIVEREARIDDERPIISGVFHNRLKKGMPLQSCATVQYALGKRKPKLHEKDLKMESDYNTYIHKGLPPGPIASPGKSSLVAAVNPKEVDYLFFVLKDDDSGTHIFSKSYKEHIKAKTNN